MKRYRMLALATIALSCCQGRGNGNDNQSSDLQRVTFVNSAQQVSFSSLGKGQVPPSDDTMAQITVIRNEADWASFWDQLYASHSPKPARPPVNFAESVVMALVDTVRPTGGYSVTITAIQSTASGISVVASQVSPGPACVVTQALTKPFHIVTTPVFPGTASLQMSQSVNDCGQ